MRHRLLASALLLLAVAGCGSGSASDGAVRERSSPQPKRQVDAGAYADRVIVAVERSRNAVRRIAGATGSWEAVSAVADRGMADMSRSVRAVEAMEAPAEAAQQHASVTSGLAEMGRGMERLKSAAKAEQAAAADEALDRMLTANALLEGEMLALADSLDSKSLRAAARSADMPELGSLF